ncbi:MAG TPA: single-stranded DNA-binding protein [Planctomycetaceae bacterium]|nr:single-stranded DNA-binding protein [Planctomycetaceae bacterium]
MASFNRVILLGNLTRDPQVRYTPGGTAVSELGLAVNRTWFDQKTNSRREEVTFVDVTLWGRQAEVAGEYLSKGRQVLIEGRLQLDTWDDKESGQKRSKLRVVCENMTMVGGRTDGPRGDAPRSEGGRGDGGRGDGGRAEGPRGGGRPATENQAPAEDFQDAPQDAPQEGPPEDEVPF